MPAGLETTNRLLGVMAVVSVLEAVLLIGLAIALFVVYRRVMALVDGLEARHVVPLMARVNAILEDVKRVSAAVQGETERVDHAIRTTMDQVDGAADRVRSNVRASKRRIVGLFRGARVVIEALRQSRAA